MILVPMLAMLTSQSESSHSLQGVEVKRLKATVEKLASFHTRNTNTQGLIDSCAWLADEFKQIQGLQVELMTYKVKAGRRVPSDIDAVQVVAVLPGVTDRRIIVGGHIDSINMKDQVADPRAPGANDDASGVALTLELARLAAKTKWNQTLVFVAFSGEEQGLLGSTALAKRAKEEGWKVDAVLSNDTVGSSSNAQGQKDNKRVRVFSEEGAEHQSRELARLTEWIVRHDLKNFGIKLVFRRDRFGRGGDHTSFVAQGFSAVRFVEVYEEYSRQHTIDDGPEHMDFAYLANVARANGSVLARLAQADFPPTSVAIVRDQSHDTTIRWESHAESGHTVFWRETTSPIWQHSLNLPTGSHVTIKGVNKDDHVFAVGAIGGIPVEAK